MFSVEEIALAAALLSIVATIIIFVIGDAENRYFRCLVGGIFLVVVIGLIGIAIYSRSNNKSEEDISAQETIFSEPPASIPAPMEYPLPTQTREMETENTPAKENDPRIYSFSTCPQPCDGTNASDTFEIGTDEIFMQWNYENIPEGASYTRTWTMNGMEWVTYACKWAYDESGSVPNMSFIDLKNAKLKDPDGLHSGVWEVTMTVDGEQLLNNKVYVLGNEDSWTPQGTINKCFGRVP